MLLGQGICSFTGQVGGELGAKFMREPPSDFSTVTVTLPGMSLSESHLPKDVSQKSPDPDRGLVGRLTEQESGCL